MAVELWDESSFRWSKKKEEAAVLLAEGYSCNAVAQHIGSTFQTVYKWRQCEEFAKRVNDNVIAIRKALLKIAIANKASRLTQMDRRWKSLQDVIVARSEEMKGEAPGTDTGLLCRKLKMMGHGKSAVQVSEYSIDTGLLSEMRELERLAAQEMGDLSVNTRIVDEEGEDVPVQQINNYRVDILVNEGLKKLVETLQAQKEVSEGPPLQEPEYIKAMKALPEPSKE